MSDSGRKLKRYTPRPATLESVENAMTDTPRARASCAVAGTEAANSGPRTISAPSSSACWVPCCAPCGLPPSSLIRSWILGFWNSAKAISAAFFIDCAATPALPGADRGRISPTLTCPVPATIGSCAGPGVVNWLRVCWMPEQAPSKGAPRSRPTAVRRVAPDGFDLGGDLGGSLEFRGPTIASLLLAGRDRPGLEPPVISRWIQAYCRRIVNQTKGLRRSARATGPLFSSHCAARYSASRTVVA